MGCIFRGFHIPVDPYVMKTGRRDFIRKGALIGIAPMGVQAMLTRGELEPSEIQQGLTLEIGFPRHRMHWQPLEEVPVTFGMDEQVTEARVWDGEGILYQTVAGPSSSFRIRVGGSLGVQAVSLHDRKGRETDRAFFRVDCETVLEENTGKFTDFFDILYETLTRSNAGLGRTVRYNGKYYTYYSSWFQDHVFAAEGLKYFLPDLKTGIDLYADGQREDGMIWDNYKHPYPDRQSYWEYRFDYGGFTYRPEDPRSTALFVRIPVENIGEHTFLEGLYYAWKATGDDRWMESKLDHALKAVAFVTSSPWYWSEEQGVLKRPFSIDRWDFQSDLDAKITGKDFMGADLERTRYGAMFGDTVCLANGCGWLAEMLEHAGRNDEAEKMRTLGEQLWDRINDLSWNGEFYRHWVPLENQQELDFGVDTERQVTLSNAMALIRGVDHEKAAAIIRTYRKIREEMPESSPGEWYMCYPPFEKGWHIDKWEYMNGGVSPILAGDLALGAYDHGFEEYATDILTRLHDLAGRSGHRIRGCYKGRIPDPPDRSFRVLDLREVANGDLMAGHPESGLALGSDEADLRNLPTGRQAFAGIPFVVLDPSENNRKACLIISEGSLSVPVGQKAGSLALLHATDGHSVAGMLHIRYTDGTAHTRYIRENSEIVHFWYPKVPEIPKGIPSLALAWKGPAEKVQEVGVCAFGMDNPFPGKEIDRLEFENPERSQWAVYGITLSDGPHFFPPSIVSTIPDHWAAAHVLKALMEGLAGIRSTGVAFNRVSLTPRWQTAGVEEAATTAKYVPSGGYASYRYREQEDGTRVLEWTGSAGESEIRMPVPAGYSVEGILVDREPAEFTLQRIEQSDYALVRVEGRGVHTLEITLK